MYYVQFKFGIAKTWNNWHDLLHWFCRPLNSSTKAEGWRESVNILSKSIIYSRDMKGNWCFSSQSMTSRREIKGIHGEQFSLLSWWPTFCHLGSWTVVTSQPAVYEHFYISWYLCVPFILLLFIFLSFLFILHCIPLLLLRFVFRNPLRNWAFESTSFNPLGKENGWRWITKAGLMLPRREILLCNEPLTVTGLIQSGGDSHAGCLRAVWCCQHSFILSKTECI